MKSALAQIAKCQAAYISRILNGQADLSLEQAYAINRFLEHTEEEAHYFLLLIQYGRAGTHELKSYFLQQLEMIRKKRFLLKERFQVKTELTENAQTTYYSSWLYAAAHMFSSVRELQSKEAMARSLGISMMKTGEILDFLVTNGLVVHENGRYKMGTSRIHLGNDSPLISKHHTNWRIQALRSFDRDDSSQRNEDLHYSSIASMSRADQLNLKSLLIKTIEEYNAVVAPSPEEEVHCLSLDFFKVS